MNVREGNLRKRTNNAVMNMRDKERHDDKKNKISILKGRQRGN